MENIKISIIVPSYNQGQYIQNVIESVLKQSYTNWELIIQDGASTDETVKVCTVYAARDNRISFVSEKDKGFADAVNKGLDKATGILAIIQSSDDFFAYEHVFKDAIDIFLNDTNLTIIAGASVVVDEKLCLLEIQERVQKYVPAENIYRLKDHFSQGATFFSLKRAFEVKKLNPSVDMVADTDFWIRMACVHPIVLNSVYQTSKIWGCVVVQPEQRSSDLSRFYLGRAKMAIEHANNTDISFNYAFKVSHANSVIHAGAKHFELLDKSVDEFKDIYRKLNNSELPVGEVKKQFTGYRNLIRSFFAAPTKPKPIVMNSKSDNYSDKNVSNQSFKWFV